LPLRLFRLLLVPPTTVCLAALLFA